MCEKEMFAFSKANTLHVLPSQHIQYLISCC